MNRGLRYTLEVWAPLVVAGLITRHWPILNMAIAVVVILTIAPLVHWVFDRRSMDMPAKDAHLDRYLDEIRGHEVPVRVIKGDKLNAFAVETMYGESCYVTQAFLDAPLDVKKAVLNHEMIHLRQDHVAWGMGIVSALLFVYGTLETPKTVAVFGLLGAAFLFYDFFRSIVKKQLVRSQIIITGIIGAYVFFFLFAFLGSFADYGLEAAYLIGRNVAGTLMMWFFSRVMVIVLVSAVVVYCFEAFTDYWASRNKDLAPAFDYLEKNFGNKHWHDFGVREVATLHPSKRTRRRINGIGRRRPAPPRTP